jgi:hypothetical protein
LKRGLALGLALGLAGLIGQAQAQADPTDLVPIDDPALAACVETALGLAPGQVPTEAEAAGLTSLTCAAVADFSALSHFSGLTRLDLSGATTGDLTPLAGLSDLRWLALTGAPVFDLAPLAGASFSLAVLHLEGTAVSDLSPLAGHLRLESGVYLDGAEVLDLTPLNGPDAEIVARTQALTVEAEVGQAVVIPQAILPHGAAVDLTPASAEGVFDPLTRTVTYASPGSYQWTWAAEDFTDYMICDPDGNCFRPGYASGGVLTVQVSAAPLPGGPAGPLLPDTGAPATFPSLGGLAALSLLLGLGCLYHRRQLA